MLVDSYSAATLLITTEGVIMNQTKATDPISVPITTVYTDQVSKIHPVRDSLRFLKMLRRYKAVDS